MVEKYTKIIMDNTNNNKRIAKNTIFLYFRTILIMLVSLYIVRVVLKTLGVVDYGIYNVVGGIVVMFGFLNSAMSMGTQRFLNYEMDENRTSYWKIMSDLLKIE